MIRDLLDASSVADIYREEGREEGRNAGRREMAQEMLESRFGALSAHELAALRAVDEATLRGLAAHLATDSRDGLRARLGLPPLG